MTFVFDLTDHFALALLGFVTRECTRKHAPSIQMQREDLTGTQKRKEESKSQTKKRKAKSEKKSEKEKEKKQSKITNNSKKQLD